MIHQRASGILLHVSSLPSDCSVGDLGAGARSFVDLLARGKQAYWQILPLGPTVHGNSPYSCYSAFAGNHLLISLSDLRQDGLLSQHQLDELTASSQHVDAAKCDYELAARAKQKALQWSFQAFRSSRDTAQAAEFDDFCERQSHWLTDFALFSALMRHFGTDDWNEWEPDLAHRQPTALNSWRERLSGEVEFEQFVQFVFYRQWQRLREYAAARGVRFFGDMPIFVAHGSADVWSHQSLFHLDEDGNETVIAGVPPDYFSKTGQLWGNPLYDWTQLDATGYQWWVRRLSWAFECFDLLRIDHFRAFQAYWEVPADAKTAVSGKWVEGPGSAPFLAAQKQLGELAIVAEDLGLITDDVHALRQDLGFPGMRVLQFGFDHAHDAYHRPDQYPTQSVAYTGTHDNHTILSWADSRLKKPTSAKWLNEYLQREDASLPLHWRLLASVMRSSAQLAIAPLQDVLGLRDWARMNLPGKADGNWIWRTTSDQFTNETAERLCQLTEESQREISS